MAGLRSEVKPHEEDEEKNSRAALQLASRFDIPSNREVDSSLPTLKSWLLGQAHREDAVGTLARLSLSQRDAVAKRGFDAWLDQHVAGKVMACAVQQAREEYALCLTQLKSTGHSPSFPSWRKDRMDEKVSAEAWARHRAEPDVSAEEYVRRKRRELREQLDKVSLPYIDTCHWIRLREVVMGDLRMNPHYVPVLAKLRTLKSEGKILCPFSFPVYVELTKQKSDDTRRAMARLIDELSDGVCLEPPNVIEQVELRRQALQSVFGRASDLNEWIWTKAAWVAGQALPEATAFSLADQNTIKKVFTDSVWTSRLIDLVEFPHGHPMPPFLEELAEKFNQDAKAYREQKTTYQRILLEEKAHRIGRLVSEYLPQIAEEIWRQFPNECAAVMKNNAGRKKPDPGMLASVQILAAVHASFFAASSNMKFEANDLIDAQHASVGLPYCDLLFVDKPLAHRLNSKPLDFGRVYGKPITGAPVEFLAWLEKL